MANKTILMSGASGLVGSRFVEMYTHEYKIANIDLTNNVNILDYASLDTFISKNPSPILIHLAAFTNTAEAEKQKGNKSGPCYQVNVTGTRNIATVCRERGIHLIHISTDFVFDGTKKELYVEEDPRHPLDWYGETKALAEEEVEKSGAEYSIVRIAYPYRSNYAAKPDIIAKIRSGLETGSLPPQFSDTTITPTFVDDIARAFKVLVEHKNAGIFHCVGSTVVSPYDLARRVATTYGYDPGIVQKGSLSDYLVSHPRPFARYSGLDNTKASRMLGVSFMTVDQGLEAIK